MLPTAILVYLNAHELLNNSEIYSSYDLPKHKLIQQEASNEHLLGNYSSLNWEFNDTFACTR